jgi:hypothetical protein
VIELACRDCGCTDEDGCMPEQGGPCSWVEPDLCSACYRERQLDSGFELA